jgi:hypothetical protein
VINKADHASWNITLLCALLVGSQHSVRLAACQMPARPCAFNPKVPNNLRNLTTTPPKLLPTTPVPLISLQPLKCPNHVYNVQRHHRMPCKLPSQPARAAGACWHSFAARTSAAIHSVYLVNKSIKQPLHWMHGWRLSVQGTSCAALQLRACVDDIAGTGCM